MELVRRLENNAARSDATGRAALERLERALFEDQQLFMLVLMRRVQMKSMRFGSGQGANHSDTQRYRADLQRGPGPKGAISCGRICERGYLGHALPAPQQQRVADHGEAAHRHRAARDHRAQVAQRRQRDAHRVDRKSVV